MRVLFTIARTSFREAIRNRTMLAILVLAIAFIASALLLAQLALDQRVRVLLDWGLFCLSAFGILLAILIGVTQVDKEVRRKNLYVVLSRPIRRWQYVLGKYLGLTATLAVQFIAMSIALVLLLVSEGVAPDGALLAALFTSFVEIMLVAGLAVFFASFSTPYLSGFFTFGVFVVGRSLPILDKLADKIDQPLAHGLLKGLVFGLPDLADFNMTPRVVHQLPIAWPEVGFLALYGFGYLVLLILLSAWIFSHRDLT